MESTTLVTCHDCNAEVEQHSTYTVGRHEICQDCYDDNYTCCNRCDEHVYNYDTQSVRTGSRDSEIWCDDCVRRAAFECDDCGDTWHDYDSNTIEDPYRTVCGHCVSSYMYCEEDECYYSHDAYEERHGGSIQSYDYKPSAQFFSVGKESLFLGIELEVEAEGSTAPRSMTSEIEDDHLYFKKDGSLHNGFEIVTHPLSFPWIKANRLKFKQMLEKLRNHGFRSYDTDTCGMHIHLSKQAFTTMHLYRFLKFFKENRSFILGISQRKESQLHAWASIDSGENQRDHFSEETMRIKSKRKTTGHSRYCAVNLNNSNTVEVRIFRGTLSYESFMKNIEFTVALYEYTQAHTELTAAAFAQFVNSNPRFKYLSRFINNSTSKHFAQAGI